MRLSARLPPSTRTPLLTSLTGKAIGSGFTPIMHLDIKPVELDLLGESHGPVTRCVRGSFLARPGNMDRGPASLVYASGQRTIWLVTVASALG